MSVLEHEACGAVKFAEAFRTSGRIVCPDCDRDCEDELSTVHRGRLYGCRECGHRFDASERDAVPIDAKTGPKEPLWNGDITDLAPGFTGPHTTAGTVATVGLLALIVVSAVVTAIGTAPLLDEEPESGEWHSYRSIVVFRNDDVQPYYRTDAMRAVDQVFIEEGVPVTAGVIPAPGNVTIDGEMPVCEYWRERRHEHPRLFEYALHGYHHQVVTGFHGGSEFGGVPLEEQNRTIVAGSRAMQDCLGTVPDVFIPPRETYDANTSRALAREGFVGVSGGNWFTEEQFDRTGPFVQGGIVHAPSAGGFVDDWSDDDVTFYDQRTLERRFDRAYANGSLYVQMIHYQYFTSEPRLATLRGLIEHMKSKEGVVFMTLGEFSRKFTEGSIQRAEDGDGWQVWEPGSDGTTAAGSIVDRYLGDLGPGWLVAPATVER